jgi:very-short-patch-repair endonuclease
VEKRVRGASRELRMLAKEMRKNPTEDEAELWQYLRGWKRMHKFRRQHPIGQFILDFYCPEKRLAVEVDGPIHEQQREQDAARDAFLAAHGIRVLRVSNAEVTSQMEATLKRIREALHAPR